MAETPAMAFRDATKPGISPPVVVRALRNINRQNRLFWRKQSKLTEQRMADDEVFHVAMNNLESEASRKVPVYFQTTLEQALANAEAKFPEKHAARKFQIAFSKKGGAAAKTDALQNLIREIARENPDIHERQLRYKLKKDSTGVVSRVDGENDVLTGDTPKIHFTDDRGRAKTAPLSGLKDRLSRAKARNKFAPTG
jgi:hypothetical protein